MYLYNYYITYHPKSDFGHKMFKLGWQINSFGFKNVLSLHIRGKYDRFINVHIQQTGLLMTEFNS